MPVYEITVREVRVFKQRVIAGNPEAALNEVVDQALTNSIRPVRTKIDTIDCDVRDISDTPMKEAPVGTVRVSPNDTLYRTSPAKNGKVDVYVYPVAHDPTGAEMLLK